MHPHRITCKVADLVQTLGWDEADNIVVEIGGTVVSGINQPEDANEKWSTPFGVRKYNKDAFIVIKNKDRNPVKSSTYNEETAPIAYHLRPSDTSTGGTPSQGVED